MTSMLEGIRVLDFGRYIAGPYCATLLGDLGAEVIRVERVAGSEDRYLLPVTRDGEGALYLQLARNKRGMTLDPMTEAGRRITHELVATADVVVANLPPQGLAAMGLDYQTLQSIRPDIILTSITALGTGGPDSDRPGFDGVAQANSGAMHLSGYPDEPMKSVVNYVDFGTASLAAFATMAALFQRAQTGEGQHVEGSLLATALSFNNNYLVEQALHAPDRVATGNRAQTAGPVDCFATRDGWILVQCVGWPLFRRWCRLMGREDLLDDPRFATDQDRGDNGPELSRIMAEWCGERTTAEALDELEKARVPAGQVFSPQQALDDPHIRAMQFFQQVSYPGLPAPAPLADTPVRFSASAAGIRERAPKLGEHTDEILTALGYSRSEIERLRQDGVI